MVPWTVDNHAFIRRLDDDEVNFTRDVENVEIVDLRNVCLQSLCFGGRRTDGIQTGSSNDNLFADQRRKASEADDNKCVKTCYTTDVGTSYMLAGAVRNVPAITVDHWICVSYTNIANLVST